ncbi:hypothetical protein V5O48_010319 [Marasmius crinis-equi]|uniref:polynucleotide adenylyltransferase n=1 Tax=Marasmius crinis-equi TaxID=585013 RepID=A0ABR3F8Q1_9AGAR
MRTSCPWLTSPLWLVVSLAWSTVVRAQRLPSTFPHNYTGIPSGGYGPDWQGYFEVSDSLPNVTAPISRNFAGNIAVDRTGHPNDTLWFWAFERENGSLTAQAGERQDEPWLVWLNGGPGSSSQLGMMTENGPLRVQGDFSITQNNFSWHKLADAFWVDQPVFDEDQLGQDFVGFLANVVKVFPSLATRPFYLTGESYAGVFIPYIAKAILSTPNPPVKLRKIAIGDGAMGSFPGYEEISTPHENKVNTLETYPQIINFDQEVFQYFREQTHLCGYDLNLTYPQTGGHFPSLKSPFNINHEPAIIFGRGRSLGNLDYVGRLKATLELVKRIDQDPPGNLKRQNRQGLTLEQWKQDHLNKGILDPDYGCFLWEEMTDFAMNFTFPWSQGEFDPYDTPDALSPEVPADPAVFLNDPRTRAAVHAPEKNWVSIFQFPFGNSTGITPAGSPWGDRSVEPAAFMSELATNASNHNVGIVIYEGNSDSLVAHFGAEVVIQNTTFGGTQGFTRRPATPFPGGAGIIHQERNITYALFRDAGHFVPRSQPEASFVFLRDFILGNDTTGLVVDNGGSATVVGGEETSLSGAVMPADTAAIFYGSLKTESSTFAPSATIAQWRSFIETATATGADSENRQGSGSASVIVGGSAISAIVTAIAIGFGLVMHQFLTAMLSQRVKGGGDGKGSAGQDIEETLDQKLHREIVAFVDCIESTTSEKYIRQEAFKRIREVIMRSSYEFGAEVQVGLYGSVPLGLELPTADLDISITAPKLRRTPQQALKRAAVLVKNAGLVAEFRGRYSARVPVVCATAVDSLGGLGVDITLNNSVGFSGIEIIRTYLAKMDALRPLVLVLKSFLNQEGLSDPATGGLGSYSLICMCISFLQLNPGKRSRECIDSPMESGSLGILLTDFLMYYGAEFPYNDSYISVSEGKLLPKSSVDWIKDSPELRISIECLVVPGRFTQPFIGNQLTLASGSDIARPTSKMHQIKSEFKSAVAKLLQGSLGDHSFLGSIICLDQNTLQARERLNRAAIALHAEQQQRFNFAPYNHQYQPQRNTYANKQRSYGHKQRIQPSNNSKQNRFQHPLPPKPAFTPYPARFTDSSGGAGAPRMASEALSGKRGGGR